MFPPPSPSTPSGVVPRRSVWDVPVALWAYGLLRALAFVAPTWAEGGRIGLGVVVVLVLFVLVLLQRSRRAWIALVILDTLSLTLLLITWFGADEAPLAIPVLAAASMVALLMPSTRRYVSGASAPPPRRATGQRRLPTVNTNRATRN